jgi:hypothetical protein
MEKSKAFIIPTGVQRERMNGAGLAGGDMFPLDDRGPDVVR